MSKNAFVSMVALLYSKLRNALRCGAFLLPAIYSGQNTDTNKEN